MEREILNALYYLGFHFKSIIIVFSLLLCINDQQIFKTVAQELDLPRPLTTSLIISSKLISFNFKNVNLNLRLFRSNKNVYKSQDLNKLKRKVLQACTDCIFDTIFQSISNSTLSVRRAQVFLNSVIFTLNQLLV